MKVERNRAWNKYTFTPEDEKDEKFLDRIAKLEEENKKLKKYYDRDKEELMESCYSLAKENDELKKENEGLKKYICEWFCK